MKIRSISFDTSFLLHEKFEIDEVIKILFKDKIPCYITSTVVSELEQLKIWGRITKSEYKNAIKRWKKSNAQIIDFKNRLLSDAFGQECMYSMKKYHGVKSFDIVNDCNILVSSLKNGIDIFLSEDFHFTSKITRYVIQEIKNTACTEYHLMCNSNLFSIDARTFLKSYNNGEINIDIIQSSMLTIKKSGKLI
jgi:rRNA-processing protein FCF1